MGKIKKKNKKI